MPPREKEFTIAAAQVGDRVQIFRSAKPTVNGVNLIGGVFIEPHAAVFDPGKVVVVHVIPAIALGQTLTIPLKLLGYRPAT